MHEYQTTPVLSKYCSKYLLWAGRCAGCSEHSDSQDRLCFEGCQRAVKSTLGVREAGVRDPEQGRLVSRERAEFLSVSPGGCWMPLCIMSSGQKLSPGYGLGHKQTFSECWQS